MDKLNAVLDRMTLPIGDNNGNRIFRKDHHLKLQGYEKQIAKEIISAMIEDLKEDNRKMQNFEGEYDHPYNWDWAVSQNKIIIVKLEESLGKLNGKTIKCISCGCELATDEVRDGMCDSCNLPECRPELL
jgi:hypothetical protein